MVAYSPYDWSMPIAAASIANTVKMAAATRIMPLLNTICAMAKPAMAKPAATQDITRDPNPTSNTTNTSDSSQATT